MAEPKQKIKEKKKEDEELRRESLGEWLPILGEFLLMEDDSWSS